MMNKWNKFSEIKPGYDEPVLCFLSNGQQVTLALNEDNQTWSMYNHDVLEDAHVILWKDLESREEIERILVSR